jgi:hypothetical protein
VTNFISILNITSVLFQKKLGGKKEELLFQDVCQDWDGETEDNHGHARSG